MKYLFTIIFFSTLLFLAPLAHAHSPEDSTVIHITDQGYDPDEVTINKGESVTFENQDSVEHWPASNIHPTHEIYSEFDPLSPIAPDDSWTFTFDKSGTWRFHDHIYPNLSGEIVVINNDGILGSIISKIKSLTNSLINLVVNSDPKDDFINKYSIANEIDTTSEQIVTDDDALVSYLLKYGAAAATSQLNNLSPLYGDCHNRAHETGRFTYELVGAKAFTECNSLCHSGCYHGATEAFFRDNGVEDLTESLDTVCGGDLNDFFMHQCVHGIGHGLMAWSDYEIHDALKTCDKLDTHANSCYSGVFMENVVGGLAEEHQSRFLSQDPHYPCNVVDEKYVRDCYFYQSSRMAILLGYDFEKITNTCLEAPEGSIGTCLASMGRDIGGTNRDNPKGAIEACSFSPEGELRTQCHGGAVQDLFWDTQGAGAAIEFCKLLSGEERDSCFLVIIDRATQVYSSESDYSLFCEEVDKEYQEVCNKV